MDWERVCAVLVLVVVGLGSFEAAEAVMNLPVHHEVSHRGQPMMVGEFPATGDNDL